MKIENIKELLGNATPGPWRTGSLASFNAGTGEPESFVYRLPRGDESETAYNRICVRGSGKMDCDADAKLIARAPQIIASLIEKLESAERALENLLKEADDGEHFITWSDQYVPLFLECRDALEKIRG